MKRVIMVGVAAALVAAFSTSAFAEGSIRSKTIVKSSSQSSSWSGSQSSVNNSYRDRLQAPGGAVGAGWCSDGAYISGPGFGAGFSAMSKVCRDKMDIETANQLWNKATARQVACYLRPALRNLCPKAK